MCYVDVCQKNKTGDDLVRDVQRGSYGTITVNGETTQIKAERGWEIVPEGIVLAADPRKEDEDF